MGFFNNSPKNKEEYVTDLAHAIFLAANDSNEVIRPAVGELKWLEKDKKRLLIDTQIQFQYLFLHLIERDILSMFGDEKRVEIIGSILHSCIEITYSAFFVPTEDNVKNYFYNNFLENFNKVSIVYSGCNTLMDKEFPLKQDNFLGILINIIALKLYDEGSSDFKLFKLDYFLSITDIVIKSYGRYKISKKINNASKMF